MPSKGVGLYSYIAPSTTFITFTGPEVTKSASCSDNFQKQHLEIESSNLPWYTFTGTFGWEVEVHGLGSVTHTHKQEINSLTGNLGSGDFVSFMETPAIIHSDTGLKSTITYGF